MAGWLPLSKVTFPWQLGEMTSWADTHLWLHSQWFMSPSPALTLSSLTLKKTTTIITLGFTTHPEKSDFYQMNKNAFRNKSKALLWGNMKDPMMQMLLCFSHILSSQSENNVQTDYAITVMTGIAYYSHFIAEGKFKTIWIFHLYVVLNTFCWAEGFFFVLL